MDLFICHTIPPRTKAAYARWFDLETGKGHSICIVTGCERTRRKVNGVYVCSMHFTRKERLANPAAAQYRRLKAKSRKRRKPFDITRAEWMELCRITGYADGVCSKTGDCAKGLTIDRIKNHLGYTLNNIRVITHSENARKGSYERTVMLASGRAALLAFEAVSVAEMVETEDALIDRI